MDDFILNDLKSIVVEVLKTDDREYLHKAVHYMIQLAELVEEEGLLSLEDEISTECNNMLPSEIKKMMNYIVDGMNPNDFQEIVSTRYVTGGFSAPERYVFLVYVTGFISIMVGESKIVTQERLYSLLPADDAEGLFKAEENNYKISNRTKERIERHCNKEIVLPSSYSEAICIRKLDGWIKDMDDLSLQRTLRELENHDLAHIMVALSGDANRKIYENLSDKLAELISRNIEISKGLSDETRKAVLATTDIVYDLAKQGDISLPTLE